MEPRVSMSWYAVAVVAGVALLSLDGHPLAGLWIGVSLAAVAAFLNGVYLVQRRRSKRMAAKFKSRRLDHFRSKWPDAKPSLIPPHRRELDRWALTQWGVIGAASAAIGLGLRADKVQPLDHVGVVYTVCSVGWLVLWASIYLSAAFDWYLITPKISGISCPGPCELAGQQRWVGVTALWCFHRGVARLLVPAALLGSAAVIGAITHSTAGRAISFSVAGVLSVALAEFQIQGKAAINFGLNARRYVGDIVWLIHETTDGVRRRPGLVVDVSAEGAKFKYVDEQGTYVYRNSSGALVKGRPFRAKHDDDNKPVALDELNERPPVTDAESPCRDGCTGVNWYCWKNPLAFSQTTSSDDPEDSNATLGRGT